MVNLKRKIIIKTLSCDGKLFLTRTRYENDVVKSIIIKRNNVENTEGEGNPSPDVDTNTDNQEETSETETDTTETDTTTDPNGETNQDTSEETSPETKDESEFEPIFTALSEDSRVALNEVEDGVVITIDFAVTNIDNVVIDNLNKPSTDQQTYYEEHGMTCSVIE